MRTERIEKSNETLDALEHTWWNENAGTIEQIWAQGEHLQQAIRAPYLSKAKKFLKGDNDRAVIWEVGCGSGWVCRLIAGDDFRIIGTDFSESQIDLARQFAAKSGKEAFCEYRLTDASTVITGHTGILIHAIVHHLSKEEAAQFFRIFENQQKGTRVFMYEPVFVGEAGKRGWLAAMLFKQIVKYYRKAAVALTGLSGNRNSELADKVQVLFDQAEKNGWFLSPKEVPFYETELRQFLEPYFEIKAHYLVNKSELEIAQGLVLHNAKKPGSLYTRILIPLAIALDRAFFKLNYRSVCKGQYFFNCFELIVK